jgi:formylglycine-generating enzyme required for sulfatase activity/serine/threonine protein kinase
MIDDRDTLGLVGETIDDKYVIEKLVGEGGFGLVYKATHKLWQKPVAIKCFKALSDAAPSMREKLLQDFIQEGSLLTELSARSASIVQARDVGTLMTPNGQWVPYMVLEWLDGLTLEELMEKHPGKKYTLGEAMRLLEPVAMALDVAHARNIAHRDIKPANVFIVGEPFSDHMLVKLLDFGIAKVVQSAADHGFTKTGGQVTSFTPAYGAPEQFTRSAGSTGPWTDVYALTLMLVELITAKPALEGDDFIQLGFASAHPEKRPTPRLHGVDLGDAVEEVLRNALAIKPADRYQTAGELWNDLRVAIGEEPMKRSTMTDRNAGRRTANGAAFAATALNPPSGGAAVRDVTTASPMSAGAPSPAGSRTGVIVGAIALVAALAGGAAFALKNKGNEGAAAKGDSSANTPAPVKAVTAVSASVAAPAPCPSTMATIVGGKFFMGHDDGDEDERPAHNVTLSPYCIDLKEVTVAEYKACSDRGDCKRASATVSWPDMTEADGKLYSSICTISDPVGKAQHPINCVDWEMASTYCKAAGGRLPTEAEWEFAARGPDGRIYPWGDEPPDETRLNACGKECVAWGVKNGVAMKSMYPGDDQFATTAPVGSFPKGTSRYGLLDVVGNVWEWVGDGFANYGKEAQKDPIGDANAKERVVRGGAFNGSFASWVRPSQRYSFAPIVRSHAVGFRCARSRMP